MYIYLLLLPPATRADHASLLRRARAKIRIYPFVNCDVIDTQTSTLVSGDSSRASLTDREVTGSILIAEELTNGLFSFSQMKVAKPGQRQTACSDEGLGH
ncbi:hypothetical protein EVAR_27482_1 [Eumeta japonica]|uniref:Uncharacterized protein n=1 Tax=Eumeta variegata TaxID=151549 RepID=A0A4C1XHB5_EUMVA|nr:hypothetical protein EVAR_27482_1 [Eumeta japonica]